MRATPWDFKKTNNELLQLQANWSNFIRKWRLFEGDSRIPIDGQNFRSHRVNLVNDLTFDLTGFRFQKRLQLNLLQLVDSVSSQFQSTKENPNSNSLSSSSASTIPQIVSKNSSSHESLPGQDTQEPSNSRRKRSSFTDMPKI